MQMPDDNKEKDQKKSTWEKVPFFAKIILVMAIVGILYFFIWGADTSDLPAFIVRIFILAVLTFLAYFILQRFMSFFEPKPFSAKENLHSRLVNLAVIAIPPNIDGKKLITVGSNAFRGADYGKITGMLKLPMYVGKIKHEADGKIIYQKDERGAPTGIPERDYIEASESEYFFVVKRGFLLPKFVYVRCHQKYVLSMENDVILKVSNLVPTMSSNYVYPFEQIFEDPSRIMNQNMHEIVVITFDHQHDLIANTTEDALRFNPYWEYSRRMQQETITTPEK
jgi:hypothetical protein